VSPKGLDEEVLVATGLMGGEGMGSFWIDRKLWS
jgi:hypothetical protein